MSAIPATSSDRELYAACPLCESTELDPAAMANWSRHPLFAQTRNRLSPLMNWKRCRRCSHVFTDGYFRPEAFAILMQGANAGQVFGKEFEGERPISARMIDKVLPFVDRGRWLDVGFGNGSLLLTAKEYGFDVVGCDLRAGSVEAIRSVGIEAHCADITQLQASPFKVISMADVLEHMPFPKVGLSAAHRLLEPGGVLFVSMPNSESPAWDILNRANANPYWGEVEHYHNFGRSRLFSLLEEMGFRPQRYGISERYRVCMEVIAVKS
jgi:SAM-dependent methyltransferase